MFWLLATIHRKTRRRHTGWHAPTVSSAIQGLKDGREASLRDWVRSSWPWMGQGIVLG